MRLFRQQPGISARERHIIVAGFHHTQFNPQFSNAPGSNAPGAQPASPAGSSSQPPDYRMFASNPAGFLHAIQAYFRGDIGHIYQHLNTLPPEVFPSTFKAAINSSHALRAFLGIANPHFSNPNGPGIFEHEAPLALARAATHLYEPQKAARALGNLAALLNKAFSAACNDPRLAASARNAMRELATNLNCIPGEENKNWANNLIRSHLESLPPEMQSVISDWLRQAKQPMPVPPQAMQKDGWIPSLKGQGWTDESLKTLRQRFDHCLSEDPNVRAEAIETFNRHYAANFGPIAQADLHRLDSLMLAIQAYERSSMEPALVVEKMKSSGWQNRFDEIRHRLVDCLDALKSGNEPLARQLVAQFNQLFGTQCGNLEASKEGVQRMEGIMEEFAKLLGNALFDRMQSRPPAQLYALTAQIKLCQWSKEKSTESFHYAADQFNQKFGSPDFRMDRYSLAQLIHLSRLIEERIEAPRETAWAVPRFPASKKAMIDEITTASEIEEIMTRLRLNGFNDEQLAALGEDISNFLVGRPANGKLITTEAFNEKYGNVFYFGKVVEPKLIMATRPRMDAAGKPILNEKGEEIMESIPTLTTNQFIVGIGNTASRARANWGKLTNKLKAELALEREVREALNR